METGILRILDANLNRAKEGLRTAEDYARFEVCAGDISGELKKIRHELQNVFSGEMQKQLLDSRDSINDPGSTEKESSESKTHSSGIAAANIKRAQEALRSLEEYTKVFTSGEAARFKELRYRLYTAEKNLFSGFPMLEKARLYIILTESLCSSSYEDTVSMLIEGGADIIQVREKHAEAGEIIDKVTRVRELLDGTGVLLTVNDRPDIARITGIDGVHGGQGDMPVKSAREVFPGGFVGLSTHSPEQTAAANLLSPDYIGIGPVFATPTKEGRPGIGTEWMKTMVETAEMPGFVIGGITRDTVSDVLREGAGRIAVCTAVISAEHPEKECRFFKNAVTNV